MPRERDIERRFRKKVEAMGGLCWKWVSPGRRGVPDRIVIMPGGAIYFVELKAPGKSPSDEQRRVHDKLRERKADVRVLDSHESVDRFLHEVTWI